MKGRFVHAEPEVRHWLAPRILAAWCWVGSLIACSLASPCQATNAGTDGLHSDEVTQIVVSMKESPEDFSNAAYFNQLLELVLDKTIPAYGPYQLERVGVISVENRLLREIELGRIDLTWLPYQRNPSHNLRPIPIRLLKHLSDYRVFLIRPGEQERFSSVKSLEDLRQLRGGVGTHWPDKAVMEFNELPLVASLSYQGLFRMLVAGRFDYFSRGIYQALPEVTRYPDIDVALEEDLLLYYESPVYFFVRADNEQLAQRLEQGLKAAVADGSFDELFTQFPRMVWAEAELASKKRRVIELAVP